MSYTQAFGYDQLNRLTTSQEGASWSQTNSYDRYGNRSIVGGPLTFSATNNRITTAGYSYDLVGNLLNDGLHSYTYDAENRISKVDAVSAYVYDGEGNRVRKLVNENLRFIYDTGGNQIAEFDGLTGALKKEYVYGASGRVATIEPAAVNSNGTRYTTSDHLGSPRVITNSSASVVSRHDYMPFGEELFNGGRTVGMGYGVADGLRQKFTSKERDNESGQDYLQHRYYSSTQGRFTSPDEPFSDQTIANPQSWNLYTYAGNNPLLFSDPSGLYKIQPDGTVVGSHDGECVEGLGCWSEKNQQWQTPGSKGDDPLVITVEDEGPAVIQVFLVSEPESSRTELLAAGAVVAFEADPEIASKLAIGAAAIALYLIHEHLSEPTSYIPPPKELPAFPDLKPVKPKTPVPGVPGKVRKRWVDSDGNIYEWDYQHGRIENGAAMVKDTLVSLIPRREYKPNQEIPQDDQ